MTLALLPLLVLAGVAAPERTLKFEDAVRDVALSPDGMVMAVSSGNFVFLYDYARLERTATLAGHEQDVYGLSFSPDGRRLASAGSDDGTIRVWDLATGEARLVLRGHENLVYHGVFSPDGKTIVSSGSDGTIRLWNADTGRMTRSIPGAFQIIWDVALSPDGRTIASLDDELKLRDAASGAVRLTMKDTSPDALAWSPDGRWVAAQRKDNAVALWNTTTGAVVRTMVGHSDSVRSLAFRRDARLLATGDYGGNLLVWDTATGRKLAELKAHASSVSALRFTADGRTLVSGSWDDTVALWPVSALAPELPPAPTPDAPKNLPAKRR